MTPSIPDLQAWRAEASDPSVNPEHDLWLKRYRTLDAAFTTLTAQFEEREAQAAKDTLALIKERDELIQQRCVLESDWLKAKEERDHAREQAETYLMYKADDVQRALKALEAMTREKNDLQQEHENERCNSTKQIMGLNGKIWQLQRQVAALREALNCPHCGGTGLYHAVNPAGEDCGTAPCDICTEQRATLTWVGEGT